MSPTNSKKQQSYGPDNLHPLSRVKTELIWEGKYDANGKRIAPLRVALPFQTVETVNESAQERQKMLLLEARATYGTKEWRNRLIWGDKKYVLPSLLPEFAGKVNLIYIDPPFDTGSDFSFTATLPDHPDTPEDDSVAFTKAPSIIEQKAYRDTWGRGLDSYLQWFYETVVLLHELLHESGSLYVHLDWNVVHYAKSILDEIFGIQNFQREIVWRIGWISGYKSAAANWIRNHDTILFFVKSQSFVFNKEYVRYPENYVRRDGAKPAGKGYPIDDVWNGSDIDRLDSIQIMSFTGEKVGYPTQKNENLLSRIIKASSNESDLVLDCFCGSGTTAAVAEKLGRQWIACDLGRFAVHTTRKRLLSIEGVKPFEVQNLGKYERQLWQTNEFNAQRSAKTQRDYVAFILKLYAAKELRGYTWLHGVKAMRMVHVGAVDAPVSVGDVRQIAAEFKRLVGTGKDAPSTNGVDVLGWDFAFELNEVARQQAAAANIQMRFLRIPRDVMDKRAVEQGDIHFFELAALAVEIRTNGRDATLRLMDFVIPPDDVPEDARKAVKHWSQWIDYWAVDWNNKGDTFHNEWQTYRARKDPKLTLEATHTYTEKGVYVVVVKVIDILGNDTTKTVKVKVK